MFSPSRWQSEARCLSDRPGRLLSPDKGNFIMDKRATESLALFCIAQRNAFYFDDWFLLLNINRKAIALAAKYLSMTSWYGHETELEEIAAATYLFVDSSHGLYRESQMIGFDLPYFSAKVRFGIAKDRIELESRPPDACLAGAGRG